MHTSRSHAGWVTYADGWSRFIGACSRRYDLAPSTFLSASPWPEKPWSISFRVALRCPLLSCFVPGTRGLLWTPQWTAPWA